MLTWRFFDPAAAAAPGICAFFFLWFRSLVLNGVVFALLFLSRAVVVFHFWTGCISVLHLLGCLCCVFSSPLCASSLRLTVVFARVVGNVSHRRCCSLFVVVVVVVVGSFDFLVYATFRAGRPLGCCR